MKQEKSRFARMIELKSLIKDMNSLLRSRSIELKLIDEPTKGNWLDRALNPNHLLNRGYTIDCRYFSTDDQPKAVYEKIPGLKELTEKFLKESDELIQKGIEGFQKEFEELDSN